MGGIRFLKEYVVHSCIKMRPEEFNVSQYAISLPEPLCERKLGNVGQVKHRAFLKWYSRITVDIRSI